MSTNLAQMELSAHIRNYALSIPGKLQLVKAAFAKALEIIPRQICDNAGLDSTDIMNKLRVKHANGEKWFGVDVDGTEGIRNNQCCSKAWVDQQTWPWLR